VIQRIEIGPIRGISITDLQFVPFSGIILRSRIFKWWILWFEDLSVPWWILLRIWMLRKACFASHLY